MILACDLGTGGVKASLYQEDGTLLEARFQSYPTNYLSEGRHEQRPEDWWGAVCATTRMLMKNRDAAGVRAVSLSGFSMTAVPMGADGGLLTEWVPIWSDARAKRETDAFFEAIDEEAWYRLTGNGDPPELYPAMKLMWLRRNKPEIWRRTKKVLGSKDYVNYRMTGEMATDHSYASGSGVYDLMRQRLSGHLLEAAGLTKELFPEIVESHERIGRVTREAALEMGLNAGTPVMCGGVDNAMMALGTTGARRFTPYTSLGSSAWIAVTSETPVLDSVSRPFIFAFAQKGLYTSGVSIFAAGNALLWASEMLCPDCRAEERMARVNQLAEQSAPGANGVMFNPTLSGASPQEPSGALKGAFGGLTMGATRADLLRAVMEGVALSLDVCCLSALKKALPLGSDMFLTGGGGKSRLWMQIFSDIYGMNVLRSEAGQEAASRGAVMAALRGLGDVRDYQAFDEWLDAGERFCPNESHQEKYDQLRRDFARWIGQGASPEKHAKEAENQ